MPLSLVIKPGWSRVSATRCRNDGQDAAAAATFDVGGIMGAGVLVSAGPNGAQVDSLQSNVFSGGAGYANAFNRTFVVMAPGDPSAVIHAVLALPVQVGSLGGVPAGVGDGAGPEVPDLSTGQVISQAGIAGPGAPNGLTVLLDTACDRSGAVTSGGNANSHDLNIHFSSREGAGLVIPPGFSAIAAVVCVGYLTTAVVAAANAFPMASISISGGDLSTPLGQGPGAEAYRALARFLATVTPPLK